MKKTLLMLVIIFSWCSIAAIGQTKREKKVEKDGYVWYEISKDGKYGAEDTNGRIIIPMQYRFVSYYGITDGWFGVGDNKYLGAYEKNGKCVISTNRGYSSVTKQKSGDVYWYTVEKGGMVGACDANGNEIISPNRGYSSVCKHKVKDEYWYSVEKGGMEGACDTNGKEIISPNRGYSSVCKHKEYDGGYWYSVEKGGMEGACDANGIEIVAPRYNSIIYNDVDNVFKYKDSNGKFVSTGISLKGASYVSSSSSSSSSISNITLDFIFDLYIQKSANEEVNPIPKMPKNGSNTFYEYVVRIEFKTSSIVYKIMTIDRKNNDRIEVLESHSIVPSSSNLAITSDGKIQFSEYENGNPKGVLVCNDGFVAIGKWDGRIFVEGWNFLPLNMYDKTGGTLGNMVSLYKERIDGFNRNTNFKHTRAGESNFNEKYLKLKTALQKYNWKKLL